MSVALTKWFVPFGLGMKFNKIKVEIYMLLFFTRPKTVERKPIKKYTVVQP